MFLNHFENLVEGHVYRMGALETEEFGKLIEALEVL
jgi:hypothetical protein